MKYILPFVMALVILAGITLAITPFVFDFFFPIKENVIREADPEAAEDALNVWFLSPKANFRDVEAARQRSQTKSTAWFVFKVKRDAVERFISAKKLVQLDLNDEILNTTFFANSPPFDWWQPKSLGRSSYFKGIDQGRHLALIYNAETESGALVSSISANMGDKKP
ncbi:MAG: hypothetical protein DSZ29_07535 [Aquificaceae bacterium]|nr:MAG: hypothetical protein DSZ29_07535 [Aquificaceae bacterium]